MDFSDYNINYTNYNKINKKILGKFKDKINGKIIVNIIGLKSKFYYYKIYNKNKEYKKNKIVKYKIKN
jgi:hypothetical protein